MVRNRKTRPAPVIVEQIARPGLTHDACRSCRGTGKIIGKECPRCEGDGTDRFYSVERPKF
jgi:DnaJ-class molecular chaperone